MSRNWLFVIFYFFVALTINAGVCGSKSTSAETLDEDACNAEIERVRDELIEAGLLQATQEEQDQLAQKRLKQRQEHQESIRTKNEAFRAAKAAHREAQKRQALRKKQGQHQDKREGVQNSQATSLGEESVDKAQDELKEDL